MNWAHRQVDVAGWNGAIHDLVDGRCSLAGLWGEAGLARMALHGDDEARILVLACPSGHYPSVGRWHAPAIRLERALADLHGLKAEGALDTRPWLDHGRWAVSQPLGDPRLSDG
ncbi:MAG TPA: hypothetical protein VGF33_09230, partial [Caulobacteraceae bacterium]